MAGLRKALGAARRVAIGGPGRDLWAFGAILLVLTAVSLRWLWLYRYGQPYDIDESGYLSIALNNHRGLFDGGLRGWWDSVLSPSVQAPLMTAATTPAFVLAGPNAIVGLLVTLAFGLVAVTATFFLGRRIGGPRVGWLAGLLAIGAPMLLNFSRSYNFAIAATATLVLALLALARSDHLLSRRWSIALGLFLGLTALARTMALAFLPALILAMAIAVAVGPERGRRAVNAVLAAGVGLAVALPWYWVNWSRVYEYLTSFGYGSRAREYGTSEPFFSRAAWRLTSQYVVHSVYLPFVVLMVVGAVTLVVVTGWRARRQGARPVALAVLRSPLMPSALLVLEGLTALHSSQNKGSAFVAPLIPAMAVCAAWAFARLPVRPRQLLTAATVAVVVLNVVVSADLGTRLARPRYLDVPELGLLPVTSGRGALQGYEADTGTVVLTAAQPVSRKEGVAWVAASADVAARLRAHDGPIVVTAFGFRHRLVNVNSVQFEELSAGEPPLPLDQVAPLVTTDTADGYAAWLSEGGGAAGVCNLLTATGNYYEIAPPVTPAFMEEAARRAGFVVASQWSLPDERVVSLWRRPATCPK